MDNTEILDEVAAYCAARRWRETNLGLRAVGNAHVVARIREGRALGVTIDRLRAWMRDNPPVRVRAATVAHHD